MSAEVLTILAQAAKRRPIVHQATAAVNFAAAGTAYAAVFVAKHDVVIDQVEFLSEVPISSGTNTVDLFRNRATTEAAIVTQFDPDTLVAKTLTEKSVSSTYGVLVAGDAVVLKVVNGVAAVGDVSVVVSFHYSRSARK